MQPAAWSQAFFETVASERLVNARRVLVFRVIYAAVTLLWTGSSAWLSPRPSAAAAAQLPWLAFYAVASVVAWGVARRTPGTLRKSWWLLALLDLPLLVGSQWVALELSSYRLARIESMLAQLLLVVVIAQLSLSRPVIYTVAAGAVTGHLLMLRWIDFANFGGRLVFTPLFFGVAAWFLAYLPTRLLRVLEGAALERVRRERLSRFFSPAVADEISSTTGAEAVAKRYEVTVLFADLREFTRASAELLPEDVARMVELHHAAMVEVVFRHGGTLDKFLGDGLLAYFGAPLPQPDHARRAVLAASEIVREVDLLRAKADTLPVLPVVVTLHSGSAVVGTLGPSVRREFTILGDVVNVASRIEGVAKERNIQILASGETRAAAGAEFTWKDQPPAKIRGKTAPLALFELALTGHPLTGDASEPAGER